MILKKHLNEFITNTKPNNLSKRDFYQFSIKLGKNLYRNCYDYNINIEDFEKLITIYQSIIPHNKIKYDSHHIYQFNNLNLIVLPDGYSLCYDYNNYKYKNYKFKNSYDIRFISCIRTQYNCTKFPTKFKYDNIIKIEKLIFPLDKKIELIMLKKIDEENIISYEIFLEIQLGADFEKVIEHIQNIQKNITIT